MTTRIAAASRPLVPYGIAALTGIALWLWATIASGAREPWDVPLYWNAIYPIAMMVAAALGYAFPDKPWRWALTIFIAQFAAMTVRAGELGNLWPLGLLLFFALSVPGMAFGRMGAWLRRRLTVE
jgi:hypothetical protein